jgi:hypothetical protein
MTHKISFYALLIGMLIVGNVSWAMEKDNTLTSTNELFLTIGINVYHVPKTKSITKCNDDNANLIFQKLTSKCPNMSKCLNATEIFDKTNLFQRLKILQKCKNNPNDKIILISKKSDNYTQLILQEDNTKTDLVELTLYTQNIIGKFPNIVALEKVYLDNYAEIAQMIQDSSWDGIDQNEKDKVAAIHKQQNKSYLPAWINYQTVGSSIGLLAFIYILYKTKLLTTLTNPLFSAMSSHP